MDMSSACSQVTFRVVRSWPVLPIMLLMLMAAIVRAGAPDEHALIELARAAVKAEVEGKDPPKIDHKSPTRPVFVTIERKGRVMGCRGGLECRTRSLEEEIVMAAR